MNYTVVGECRLDNVRQADDYQNGEKVGKKTVVDIVTWGEKVPVRVDPSFSKELKLGITGEAKLSSEIIRVDNISKFEKNGKQQEYIKKGTFFRAESLMGFTPNNSK